MSSQNKHENYDDTSALCWSWPIIGQQQSHTKHRNRNNVSGINIDNDYKTTVALPAMGCDGHVPTNLSSFDTCISLVNIVTQNMLYSCFWRSQHSSAPNCHTNTMSTIFRNWCQNRLHRNRSQFIVKSLTPAKGCYFFIKHDVEYS